jgi:peptidoglycan/LPS O-acetylase OafA/YrhL
MNLKDRLDKTNDGDERRYHLDWLRVLAVLLLVYFHAAAVFYQGELGEFYIQNDLLSSALGWLIFLSISGICHYFFSLQGLLLGFL